MEFEIQRLSQELFLTDQQAEKFAVTYREYAAKLDEFFQKKEGPKGKEHGRKHGHAPMPKER